MKIEQRELLKLTRREKEKSSIEGNSSKSALLDFLSAVCRLALQVKFQQSLRHGAKVHYHQFCLSDLYQVLKIEVEKESWEKLPVTTVF